MFDARVDDVAFNLLGDDVGLGDELERIAVMRSLPLAQGGLGLHRYSGLAGEVACVASRGMVTRFLWEHAPH